MKEYKCLRCCFHFCSENGMPYCPACDCESLEDITFNDDIYFKKEQLESHHIHPKFMNNKKGNGKQFLISKKSHIVLHNKIMNWIWKEIPKKHQEEIIKIIINKSKKFINIK